MKDKDAIKAVFDEILAMSEDEFRAALKSHENSALAQALIHSGRSFTGDLGTGQIKRKAMDISKAILTRMKKAKDGHGIVSVICDLVESSDEIDYHDVADVIKCNPTMLAELAHEFKKRKMMKGATVDEVNLTEIFKGL